VQPEPRVRDAERFDAPAIASIGSRAMSAQYAGLVDPGAVQAAIEQTYAVEVVETCIELCREAPDAQFLVAEQATAVVGYYRERMGVHFPDGTQPFRLVLMRYR
jgi:hypothetical protein